MSYGSPKKNSSPPLRRSEPNLACSNDINDNISQRKRKRGDEADLQRMENMMLDMKSMFSELVSQQEQHNIKIDALHSALEGYEHSPDIKEMAIQFELADIFGLKKYYNILCQEILV
ncbi:unnamed protein product [Arctia plantaginis]|uniref:Uncharacterized protein n=1 Tax=Arctia plantaginis TaxID=874455 RepID=A0A8S0ZVC0_ARCPL|nr:unnamed protein product [Arctia plantaginis]